MKVQKISSFQWSTIEKRLNEINDWATNGGSERAKELHKKRNKLFVWERIKAICDDDSEFFEIGALGTGCNLKDYIFY